jgi:hypothetical protein
MVFLLSSREQPVTLPETDKGVRSPNPPSQEPDEDFSIRPLLYLRVSLIPDTYNSPPISLGNLSLEIGIGKRMVFHRDGQPPFSTHLGNALGNCETPQNPAPFKAKITMMV